MNHRLRPGPAPFARAVIAFAAAALVGTAAAAEKAAAPVVTGTSDAAAAPVAAAPAAGTGSQPAKADPATNPPVKKVEKPDPGPTGTQPEAAKSAAKADAAKPAAAKPEAGKSEAGKPEAGKPEAGKPEATKPEAAKPEAAKPEAAKSGPAQSEPVKPGQAPAAATPAAPTAPPAAAPAAPPPASSPEAEAVWRAYEKRWSETEDYSAGFRQVIEVPDVGSRVESAGRFFFAKPGLVRWDYVEGPPQTVVGDGTWIWLYQPDLQQVYKIPYAQAFGRGGLVELLAGREGVSERYRTSIQRPDDKTVRILLNSLTEGGGNLEVTLEADTFDLRGVIVHDAAGSTTSMTFAEPRRNQGVDRARFTFTPPPSVDIISDNEAGF